MKAVYLVSLGLSVLAWAGCGASRAAPGSVEEPAPAAVYKAGNGLRLTPAARDLVGLKTADVADHEIAGHGRKVAVPIGALVRAVKGDFVYVANGPWFLRTPVKVSVTDNAWAHVADGLYEGDTVVAQGARNLWLAELQAVNGGVGCADGK